MDFDRRRRRPDLCRKRQLSDVPGRSDLYSSIEPAGSVDLVDEWFSVFVPDGSLRRGSSFRLPRCYTVGAMKRSLTQIAATTGARLIGDGSVEVGGVASIASAGPGDLV